MKLEFSLYISGKNYQKLNFMQIRSVWAEFSQVDWQIGMRKLIVAVPNFANSSKKIISFAPIKVHIYRPNGHLQSSQLEKWHVT
jgi:hypothetical protein